MSAIQYLKDDLLLEVGRIAALRGSLRLSLPSAGDALLSARLGDQGIERLMLDGCELPEICQALVTLARVRGVACEAVQQLAQVATEFGAEFESAAAVANGSWTCLGGDEERDYGLFLGESVRAGVLEPQWRHMTVQDLRASVQRLEQASEILRPLGWVMQAARSEARGQKP